MNCRISYNTSEDTVTEQNFVQCVVAAVVKGVYEILEFIDA